VDNPANYAFGKALPRQKKQVKKTPFKTKNVIPNWPVLAANGWPHAPANSQLGVDIELGNN
jgi:hypothetical protein